MFNDIQQKIMSKDFKLTEMLNCILVNFNLGCITNNQRQELTSLAYANATPEAEYQSVDAQITARFEALEARVTTLESQLASLASGETPSIPDADEYPEYVQPTGAHDAYHTGDKVTYEGKHYICKMDNCVWTPATYPQAWEEVKDGDTDE